MKTARSIPARGWRVCGAVMHFFRAGSPVSLCGSAPRSGQPFALDGAHKVPCRACADRHTNLWAKKGGA